MELPNTPDTAPPKNEKTESDVSINSSATVKAPDKSPEVTIAPQETPGKKPEDIYHSAAIPGTKLTKEEKRRILQEKEEFKVRFQQARHIIVLLLILSLGWLAWIHIDLSPENTFLSFFGIQENLGQSLDTLKTETSRSERENIKIEKNIATLDEKIKTKKYSRHSDLIQEIRDGQLQWYDETNEVGELVFGISDAVPRITEYFNSREYQDPNEVLSGKHGDISIKNLQVSRKEVNFSVESTQILGKVFFLNIEFIEMLNSFPFLKNGKLTQFSRQEDKDQHDSMSFSVRLERQEENEIDAADARFNEYLKWLNSVTS